MSIVLKDVTLNNKKTDILIEDNIIKKIGENLSADTVIDCKNKAALPGLINLHTHASMTLLRGYADDMKLQEWLNEKIWPVEAKLTDDDIYWGTKLACLEMIKTGTTCFNDQYFRLEPAAKAVEEMGMRAFLSSVFLDVFDSGDQKGDTEKIVKKLKEDFSDLITPCLGPHALYTVNADNLKWIKEFADKNDLLIHFHLSETEQEVKDCEKNNGKRPVHYLEELGFLGKNLICAHGVWFDDKEIEVLAKNDVKIAHCPVSNMKLSVGSAIRFNELNKAGVIIGLGTDGTASNNSLDMFQEMKTAAILQKYVTNNPEILDAKQTFEMATLNGAKALNLDAGIIEEGKLADLILIDLNNISMVPGHNLTSDLVYSANGSIVTDMIINGKIVMQDRKVENEQEIIKKGKEAAKKLVNFK